MAFRPKIADKITIDGEVYKIAAHPAAKGMPYGQTGRRATVYQVLDKTKKAHALKVFTLAFRKAQIAQNAKKLNQLASLPGIGAARRYVLNSTQDANLLASQPDLQLAVLMPWVDGMTWQELVLNRQELSLVESRQLAHCFCGVLSALEEKGIAHCDLSGPNVMVQLGEQSRVSLVDLEDMYAQDLVEPERKPSGSDGYAHKTAGAGLWGAEADRFAGAVLIAEMLAWCDPRVREAAYGEQYFDPDEIQLDTPRAALLQQVLVEHWGDQIADLFVKAWQSNTLKGCPKLADWHKAIRELEKEQAKRYIVELKQLIDQGELETAHELAETTYSLAPNEVAMLWIPLLMRLGGEAEDAGKPSQALEHFELALQIGPSGSQASELEVILNRLKKARIKIKPALVKSARSSRSRPSASAIQDDDSFWGKLFGPQKKRPFSISISLLGLGGILLYYFGVISFTPKAILFSFGIDSSQRVQVPATPALRMQATLTNRPPTERPHTPTLAPSATPAPVLLFEEDFEGLIDRDWRTTAQWLVVADGPNHFWQGHGTAELHKASFIHVDYALEARFRVIHSIPSSRNGIVISIKHRDENTNYQIYLTVPTNRVECIGRTSRDRDSNLTTILILACSSDLDLSPGIWYTIRFEIEDGWLRFFVDNRLVMSANADELIPTGGIAIRAYGGSFVEIDDLRVWSLER